MNKSFAGLTAIILILTLTISILVSGCTQQREPDQAATQGWQWPGQVHIVAQGQSGLAKYVSWTSVMEAGTGMAIRVIPEANPGKCMRYLKDGEMFLGSASNSALRDVMEAKNDLATLEGGPFQARVVWVHDLANSGFFVRGDSPIKTLYDIGPGTRFSVWNKLESTLNPARSLLAWIQLDESRIKWVDAGSFEGAMRAVAEGRADIGFGFPTSPALYEVAAAPQGIRFLDLNSETDPEGARRWQSRSPLYSFGPIATGVPEAIGHWGTVGYILDVSTAESDQQLVYHFARWLDENYAGYKDTYDSNKYMTIDHLMEALKTTYIPVHQGLIEYLKEKGLWTDQHEKRQQENLELFKAYIKAYEEAKTLAVNKGIEISPANPAWINLWENYKLQQQIPMIGLHISLTDGGETVMRTTNPGIKPQTSGPENRSFSQPVSSNN